ncbi:hypothetical protein NDI86_20450 [Halomicroarcula sp. S3CR25-11]|uniref:Uncharacterized protein n=1 Tax=Haloarcula onubensis TaxID=2950539 RepID=A0ABU2FW59_9EURY|nr:hypothetical protein [Halomicroarcula sp. S3CR25-11]
MAADYVRRTAITRLSVDGEQRELLGETISENIGMQYVRRGQQSSRRTGNSQLALKSGTVTPSGGFTAHPDGFEVEDTDKPHPQRAKSSD